MAHGESRSRNDVYNTSLRKIIFRTPGTGRSLAGKMLYDEELKPIEDYEWKYR